MQFDQKRREFITLLGGAAATWPIAARAQQVPVVGFLATTSPAPFAHLVAASARPSGGGFLRRSQRRNRISLGRGPVDQVPALAADLVQRQVAVIVTTGGETSAVAAKAATKTIPIVFNTGTDPVRLGLLPASPVPVAMRLASISSPRSWRRNA